MEKLVVDVGIEKDTFDKDNMTEFAKVSGLAERTVGNIFFSIIS